MASYYTGKKEAAHVVNDKPGGEGKGEGELLLGFPISTITKNSGPLRLGQPLSAVTDRLHLKISAA
jgi:hypothetical protein